MLGAPRGMPISDEGAFLEKIKSRGGFKSDERGLAANTIPKIV
jgi:hypothetical protein